MLDDEAVIALARRYAEEREWLFPEPVIVEKAGTFFGFLGEPRLVKVLTNGHNFGTKAWFDIDRKEGRVLEAGYVPY